MGEAGLATPSPRAAASGPGPPRASFASGPGDACRSRVTSTAASGCVSLDPVASWSLEASVSFGAVPAGVAAAGVVAAWGKAAGAEVPSELGGREWVLSSAGLAESSPVVITVRRILRGAELCQRS